MDNLEQKISNWPKYKLSFKANFKIKTKLYFILLKRGLSLWLQNFSWPYLNIKQFSAVALLVVFIFSSTSFYAYGSEQVVPGTTLYPLKRTLEDLNKKLVVATPDKVDNYNKISTRRLQEALVLSEKGQTFTDENDVRNNNRLEKNIEEALNNFKESINEAKNLENDDLQNLAGKIDDEAEEHIRELKKIEQKVDGNEHPELYNKILSAQELIKKYKESLRQSGDEKDDKEEQKNLNENQSPLIKNNEHKIRSSKESRESSNIKNEKGDRNTETKDNQEAVNQNKEAEKENLNNEAAETELEKNQEATNSNENKEEQSTSRTSTYQEEESNQSLEENNNKEVIKEGENIIKSQDRREEEAEKEEKDKND